jgi:hypothetical protein
MSISQVILGNFLEDTPVFQASIDKEAWSNLLAKLKTKSSNIEESSSIIYYTENEIHIIDSIGNKRINRCQTNIKNGNLGKNYFLVKYTEKIIPVIEPQFEYFNKQIAQITKLIIDSIPIYFKKYNENSLEYYTIYGIFTNEQDIKLFMDVVSKYNFY